MWILSQDKKQLLDLRTVEAFEYMGKDFLAKTEESLYRLGEYDDPDEVQWIMNEIAALDPFKYGEVYRMPRRLTLDHRQMTLTQAVNLIDPATRPFELARYEYYGGFKGQEAKEKALLAAAQIAADVLYEKIEQDGDWNSGGKED